MKHLSEWTSSAHYPPNPLSISSLADLKIKGRTWCKPVWFLERLLAKMKAENPDLRYGAGPMFLSCFMWQDMGFLELLSHSDEQRKAVFNPTWALFSERIYLVDGALLTCITRETASIWDHLGLLNLLAQALVEPGRYKGCPWLQQQWTVANVSSLAEPKGV